MIENNITWASGVALFEAGKYEEAMQVFTSIINGSDPSEERELCIKDLYECFVYPNESEFRENYAKNAREEGFCTYEELELDFFPLSDTRYYVFNSKHRMFEGLLDINVLGSFLKGEGLRKRFGGVLIAKPKLWGDITQELSKGKFEEIYWLFDRADTYLASFLKIEGIRTLLEDAIFFHSSDELLNYFRKNEARYLPKNVVSSNEEKYKNIFSQIHKERVAKEKEAESVFLSIGIPSYNRGKKALECVRKILSCEYDSEIEVLVSDNGSKDDPDYTSISQLNDSRVHYHHFETNRGIAENVMNLFRMSKGKYLMLISDEDALIQENLYECLCLLTNEETVGTFAFSGEGGNLGPRGCSKVERGSVSIEYGINCNYISGIAFDVERYRQYKIEEQLRRAKDNIFVKYYIHCSIGGLMGVHAGYVSSDIRIARAGESCEQDDTIKDYMTVNHRIAQQNGAISLFKGYIGEDELIELFGERCWKTYFLLSLAYATKYKEIMSRKNINWRTICLRIHWNNMQQLKMVTNNKEKRIALSKEIKQLFRENLFHAGIPDNATIVYQLSNKLILDDLEEQSDWSDMDVEFYDKKARQMLRLD